MKKIMLVLTVGIIGFACNQSFAIELLKQEPAKGSLTNGTIVYVDDGTCPKGKINKVVGGNGSTISRQKSCVAKPK